VARQTRAAVLASKSLDSRVAVSLRLVSGGSGTPQCMSIIESLPTDDEAGAPDELKDSMRTSVRSTRTMRKASIPIPWPAFASSSRLTLSTSGMHS